MDNSKMDITRDEMIDIVIGRLQKLRVSSGISRAEDRGIHLGKVKAAMAVLEKKLTPLDPMDLKVFLDAVKRGQC